MRAAGEPPGPLHPDPHAGAQADCQQGARGERGQRHTQICKDQVRRRSMFGCNSLPWCFHAQRHAAGAARVPAGDAAAAAGRFSAYRHAHGPCIFLTCCRDVKALFTDWRNGFYEHNKLANVYTAFELQRRWVSEQYCGFLQLQFWSVHQRQGPPATAWVSLVAYLHFTWWQVSATRQVVETCPASHGQSLAVMLLRL